MKKIKNFVLGADGVFTDGSYYYTAKGKVMKKYGPDDNDALDLLSNFLNIHVISGDKRGFPITKKRIQTDMGFKLDPVSTFKRIDWIKKHYNPKETVYMGDGIFDSLVFKDVAYGIAPANSIDITKKRADFVTKRRGGEGAVAEACLHILSKFFNKNLDQALQGFKSSGEWKGK